MSETTQPQQQTWIQDVALGGLFRLHLDDKAAFATALVDRSKPRSQQMEALAHLDWPPAEQLSAVFDATVASIMPAPFLRQEFRPGRCVSPFLANLGVTTDVDNQTPDHPVRSYLWPTHMPDGSLTLEPGETHLVSWPSSSPKMHTHLPNGTIRSSSTHVPPLQSPHAILTTRRIVIVGKIVQPIAVREDYSLGLALLSPALDELRSSLRQVQRWRARQNLWWSLHLRYEWLCEFGRITVTPPEKKRVLSNRSTAGEPSFSVYAHLTYPFGAADEIVLDATSVGTDALLSTLHAQVAETTRDVTGAEIHPPTVSEKEVLGGMLLNRKDHQQKTSYLVQGAYPYSMPTSFQPHSGGTN